MSIDDLPPDEIELKQQLLLQKVPATGSIGNKNLRCQLSDWSDDLYWAIRNRLIERGSLEPGRGKGGSVKRVNVNSNTTDTTDASETSETPSSINNNLDYQVSIYSKESELYMPVSEVLRNQWAKSQGFDSYLVEVTAKQGSRQTWGKWTRPDIIAVGYKTFPYVPGRYLEVVTFEVKPTATTDVSAVYEAIAHRRASTRSYVIAHIPENKTNEFAGVKEALIDEAKKFGVGVIIVDDPKDFNTWEVELDAERLEPDPAKLNEFIAQQTTGELKEQIVRWFK